MQPPRLIALDMDGTLLGPDHQVTPRGEAAIRGLTEAGVVVALATGRPTRMTTSFVHDLGLEYGIVFNGAACYRASDASVDYHHAMDRETGLRVIERLRTRLPEIRLGMETEHGWYLDPVLEERRRSVPRLAAYAPPDGVGAIEDFVQQRIVKVFARHPELGADQMAEALEDIDVYCTWTLLELLEVMHGEVNKREAIKHLGASLGIAREEIAAFGDGHNDVQAIEWAGWGVATANASEAARAAADEVTASNEDDGVAQVLERWLAEIRGA